MSGIKDFSYFINTLFKTSDKSYDKSTKKDDDNKNKKLSLNDQTIKYLQDMHRDISQMLKEVQIISGMYKSRDAQKPKDSRNNTESDKSDKTDKESGPKLSQKKSKDINKSQKKVNNKGILLDGFKSVTDIAKTLDKQFGILSFIKKTVGDLQVLSKKSITSSSILIDKEFRSMQLGMGLSNKDAMGLGQSMDMLNIDKSDLAYLTEGQREALSELTGMFDKLYSSVDMEAITKLGNSIFMMVQKVQMVLTALETHVMNILTAVQPIIDIANELLSELFDIVNSILGSDEFKTILQTLTNIILEAVNFLKPIISLLMETIKSLLDSLMPVLNVIGSILGTAITLLMNVFKPVISIIANGLSIAGEMLAKMFEMLSPIYNLVSEFYTSLMPLFNTVGDLLTNVFTAIMSVYEVVIGVFMDLLKPLFDILIEFTSIVTSVLGDVIGVLLEFLEPLTDVVMDIIGPIMEWMKPVFKVIAQVISKVYSFFATIINTMIDIYNFLSWGKDKEHIKTELDLNIDSIVDSNIELSKRKGVASTYAGANNVSTITNQSRQTNTSITANFNQQIFGTASAYATELQKQNYESNQVLAELVEGAL